MTTRWMVSCWLLVSLLIPALAGAQQETGDPGPTMIVLDASGSMWGQIEGRTKIEIARAALSELLAGWTSLPTLGLTAYGHRREGDCDDIETLVAVAPENGSAIVSAAEGINPKGKTPLTDAVRHAAEVLNYADEPANVILISDGRETCGADPCATGAELESAGLDFTAHVIGFGVSGPEQAGLRCLAENTGGEFFAADQAQSLRDALQRVARRMEENRTGVTLKAVDRPQGAALEDENLRWWVSPLEGGEAVLEGEANSRPYLALDPGTYTARVTLGEAEAEKTFQVEAGGNSVEELVLEFQAEVEAPERATAGSDFQVRWQGPDKDGDYVTIVSSGAPEGEYATYRYTRDGSPLTLRAPDSAGSYEVRYLSGQSNTTLAWTGMEVEPAEASVTAPDVVAAGGSFQTTWRGPNNDGDYITIVEVGAPEGDYGRYSYTKDGSPVELRAPDAAGEYEVRYVTGQSDKVLARDTITVEAVTAGLEVPAEVGAGATFQVTWVGPDTEGDYVTIVEAGAPEGEYGAYSYTRRGSPAELRAPDIAGEYEVRYVTGQSEKVLAREAITVETVTASFEAPAEVTAGESFQVSWEGPDNGGDYITVVPVGAPDDEYGDYAYTSRGSPAELTAPETPGSYELRYITGQAGLVLTRRSLSVR